MEIYFSGSISGGREKAAIYPFIIECLQPYGPVLSEFVGDQTTTNLGTGTLTPTQIYDRDIGLIDQARVVVAEVTVPSFGVGVEIAYAGAAGKPVLALCQTVDGKRLSAMIEGDPNVTVVRYVNRHDIAAAIKQFFAQLKQGIIAD